MPFINPWHGGRAVTPEAFENVFAPLVKKKFLNVEQILMGIRAGAILPDKLPPAAKKAVHEELTRRTKDQMTRSMLLVLLLGTMGEIKYKTRLQKYLFLADKQFAQQKGRKPDKLVFDWKPHKFGPFSESLDLCVNRNLKNNTIKAFTVQEANKSEGVGYQLTVKGRAQFNDMLKTFGNTSKLIHGMLHPFQDDSSQNQLLKFVYSMHPEYTTESQIRDKINNLDDV